MLGGERTAQVRRNDSQSVWNVRFVANEEFDTRSSLQNRKFSVNFLEPAVQRVERFEAGEVVHQQYPICTSVASLCGSSVSFAAYCIPYLYFYSLSVHEYCARGKVP